MAVKHVLLDFRVPDVCVGDESVRDELFQTLRKFKTKGPVVSTDLGDGKDCVYIFVGEDGRCVL